MKDYRKTVEERYDAERLHPYDNRYAIVNPVGFHISSAYHSGLYQIVNRMRADGLDLSKAKVVDIGCGKGYWTRYLAEIAESSANVCGLELSDTRLDIARSFNPSIKYVKGDILEEGTVDELGRGAWDVALAMAVFMHFNDQQLEKAWRNVAALLKQGGYFIFVDVCAKRHSAAGADADSAGFSAGEVRAAASRNGLEEVLTIKRFKRIGKAHTALLPERMNPSVVRMCERVVPGRPGTLMILFKKK